MENLFHPSDDSLAGDDEFTPTGIRRWNDFRYQKKLTSLAKVIVAAGGWDPPEAVGMCEVEGRRVLEDLAAHPILSRYGYRVIHRDGPDHRGTEVACLYREKRVGVGQWETIPSVLARRGEHTRDLLCLELVWGRDTLEMILVHLISKYGGEGVTAVPRREQVEQMVGLVDSLERKHPGRWKVVAGDFNDPPGALSMEPVRRSGEARDQKSGDSKVRSPVEHRIDQTGIGKAQGQKPGAGPVRLIQVPLSGAPGSYKYRGKWEVIDQFLVGKGNGNFEVEGRIFSMPALMTTDASDGGKKPFRTYQGPLYQGGPSDHLPILLIISRLSSPWGGGQ